MCLVSLGDFFYGTEGSGRCAWDWISQLASINTGGGIGQWVREMGPVRNAVGKSRLWEVWEGEMYKDNFGNSGWKTLASGSSWRECSPLGSALLSAVVLVAQRNVSTLSPPVATSPCLQSQGFGSTHRHILPLASSGVPVISRCPSLACWKKKHLASQMLSLKTALIVAFRGVSPFNLAVNYRNQTSCFHMDYIH